MSSTAGSLVKAEVLVVGGGLVGTTLACALADAGLEVICVDREDPQALVGQAYDGRASAIALASQRAFAGIGLWEGLAGAAELIRDIRVSEAGSLFFLHYDSADTESGAFGHMVENRLIRQVLLARAETLPGLPMLAPETVVDLVRAEGGIEATLASGGRVRAALAIAADGRNSAIRGAAGIKVTGWQYEQAGIVCTVAHELAHGGIAHEHFLPAGPFAILPLQGNRSSIVWTERAELAPAIMALEAAGFTAELATRFGDFLGALEIVGPRWSYPLSLQFSETSIAPRLALVGDAAHAIHPIAGQGLNLGLRDVAALAEVLVDARRLGLDIGAPDVLARYERWRRFDNTLMMAMTDFLNRMFSNDLPPLRLARDLGLAVVNELGPLKRLFSRHAMGVVGTLPRLLRGEPL